MKQSVWKPDIYVTSRFLEALWNGNKEYKKTNLQNAVNLNYNVYMKYLDWLLKKEWVTIIERDGTKIVKITAKGVDVYENIVKWIDEAMAP